VAREGKKKKIQALCLLPLVLLLLSLLLVFLPLLLNLFHLS
jgi:hypothetical protein